MSESLFSPSWYRVAALRPRLRSHAEIHRHHYRGELWYVLQDTLAGKYHRFTPSAHHVIALMDGQRTVQDIWALTVEHLGDDAPTQEEMIQLMGQLHANDLLLCDVPPDSLELFRRYQRQTLQKWLQRVANPMSVRIPLFDPEAFLVRWLGLVKPLFGWFGVLLWSLLVGSAVILAGSHWSELTRDVTDQVLAPSNLVLLFFIYPVIKSFHELGHAFATKVWGGEVHEVGVMLIVLVPVPYVDASAASAFRDKHRRMVVGAAGILVELFIASLAFFVWLNVQPGLVKSICYNFMLIGSVSTLFFNGNPLLRFDGYYIFVDAIEIPNLAARCNQYLGYLVQRHLFGLRHLTTAVTEPGERFWLVVYGISSFVYRLMVVVSIAFFIAGKFFAVGVALAIWGLLAAFLVPLWKGLSFLFINPTLHRKRTRAIAVSFGLTAAILGVLCLVPFPLYSRAEGVLWLPEQAQIRAETSGFVSKLLARPNTRVEPGDALVELNDPLLQKEARVLTLRVGELETQYHLLLLEKKQITQAQIIREELNTAKVNLQQAQERLDDLTVRAQTPGVLVVPRAEDLEGKWIKQGELMAYVVDYPLDRIRAVISQDRSSLVQQRIESIQIRLTDRLNQVFPAVFEREVPAASHQLPSAALGMNGGGEIPVDPEDRKGTKAFESLFQVELRIEADDYPWHYLGSRVQIRFCHGSEPLARQWYRRVRQVFLKQLNV